MRSEQRKSPKYLEAKEALPEELQEVFDQFVNEYEFLTEVEYGRGYVAYKVLAGLVLAGWRPSANAHPDSKLESKIIQRTKFTESGTGQVGYLYFDMSAERWYFDVFAGGPETYQRSGEWDSVEDAKTDLAKRGFEKAAD